MSSMTIRPITPLAYHDRAMRETSGPAAIRVPRPSRAVHYRRGGHEGFAELHRAGPAPRGAGPPPRTGNEPAVGVGRAHPRPVPMGRSRHLGGHRPRPAPPSGPGAPGAVASPGPPPGLHGLPARQPRR